MSLQELQASIPEAAKDIRLNLQAVLQPALLSPAQRWGVAIASAAAARHSALREALVVEASKEVSAAVVEDALAAAALMAMNNIYYRFRHLVQKPVYSEKPARLRMNRLVRPATNKVDFELFSLVVSAINGCEVCIRSHEQVLMDGGVSEDQVHEAVRIAATIHAVAVSLELNSPLPSGA